MNTQKLLGLPNRLELSHPSRPHLGRLMGEPDGVGDDVRRESVTFVSIHQPILAISTR